MSTKPFISVDLPYARPFLSDFLLRFFRDRQIEGVEYVDAHEYSRIICLKNRGGDEACGSYAVRHDSDGDKLILSYSRSLDRVRDSLLKTVSHQFDLTQRPAEIGAVLRELNQQHNGLYEEGTRLPGAADPFEMAVRAVVGQQISVVAAKTLLGRIVERFGTPIATERMHLTHAFPPPSRFLNGDALDTLGACGVIRQRSRAIIELARAFALDADFLHADSSLADARAQLLSIHGIGPWTADYILMRTCGAKDIFLATDGGIKNAVKKLEVQDAWRWAERFSPWRSYLNLCLWNGL